MRRGRVLFADDADDLAQFLHQRALVVQAPGGVDQQHIGLVRRRLGQRVEGQAGGVAVRLAGDHLGARALPPDLELLHRRGAEGVAGGHDGAAAFLLIDLRQLADSGGLAGAVDAHDQHDMRLQRGVEDQRARHGGEDQGDFLGQRGLDFLVGDFLAETGAPEAGNDLLRRLRPQIGCDQEVFQFFQRLIIQAPLFEHRRDGFGDLLGAAGQAFFKAREETTKRHQAASAKRTEPVEPVTRAAIRRPGASAVVSRTGAKCSE